MISAKLAVALCLVALALSHIANAQSSPQDFVDAHNVVRAEVGVGPVTWDETVAAYAQSYADKRVGDCQMEHSQGPYGENLAEGYGELKGVDAVKFWASEKPNYDHASNSCVGDECLHYTQVVWRDSIHIGCGRSKCENGWEFVICSYEPVGNIIGFGELYSYLTVFQQNLVVPYVRSCPIFCPFLTQMVILICCGLPRLGRCSDVHPFPKKTAPAKKRPSSS